MKILRKGNFFYFIFAKQLPHLNLDEFIKEINLLIRALN